MCGVCAFRWVSTMLNAFYIAEKVKKEVSFFLMITLHFLLAGFHRMAIRETKILLVLILWFRPKPRQALTLVHISLLSAPWKG